MSLWRLFFRMKGCGNTKYLNSNIDASLSRPNRLIHLHIVWKENILATFVQSWAFHQKSVTTKTKTYKQEFVDIYNVSFQQQAIHMTWCNWILLCADTGLVYMWIDKCIIALLSLHIKGEKIIHSGGHTKLRIVFSYGQSRSSDIIGNFIWIKPMRQNLFQTCWSITCDFMLISNSFSQFSILLLILMTLLFGIGSHVNTQNIYGIKWNRIFAPKQPVHFIERCKSVS